MMSVSVEYPDRFCSGYPDSKSCYPLQPYGELLFKEVKYTQCPLFGRSFDGVVITQAPHVHTGYMNQESIRASRYHNTCVALGLCVYV